MRQVYMLVLLVAAVAAQGQPAPLQPGHGPYANRPGWKCYRGEHREDRKLAHCACELHCDEQGSVKL